MMRLQEKDNELKEFQRIIEVGMLLRRVVGFGLGLVRLRLVVGCGGVVVV